MKLRGTFNKYLNKKSIKKPQKNNVISAQVIDLLKHSPYFKNSPHIYIIYIDT